MAELKFQNVQSPMNYSALVPHIFSHFVSSDWFSMGLHSFTFLNDIIKHSV